MSASNPGIRNGIEWQCTPARFQHPLNLTIPYLFTIFADGLQVEKDCTRMIGMGRIDAHRVRVVGTIKVPETGVCI